MVGPPPERWEVDPERGTAREVAEGVWCLRLPLPWSLIPHVNAYAIRRRDGGVMLVDCGGWSGESAWAALTEGLAKAGIELAEIRTLLLTHYHSDHAGTAARLIDESGCEMLGHASHQHFTDALLRPGPIAAARERRARREGVPDKEIFSYRTVAEEIEGILSPVMPDRLLDDGEQVGEWTVLYTPGHAPSHLCLHRSRDSVLIAGDLLAATFTPYMDYGYSEDPVGEYARSLAAVAALPVELALPGHGRPVSDVPAALGIWQSGLQQETEAVLAAVRAGDAGAYEIARRTVGATAMRDSHQGPTTLSNILCHLRHLRLQRRIERVEGPDGSLLYSVGAGERRAQQPSSSGAAGTPR